MPDGAWSQRHGDKASIVCNVTSQTWHIVCKDGRWVGDYSNCTKREYTLTSSTSVTSQTWHIVCKDGRWVGDYSNCTKREYTLTSVRQ